MRSRCIEAGLIAALLAGCATAAPPLPFDTTGVNSRVSLQARDFAPGDLARDCDQLRAEYAANTATQRQDTQAIEGNRTRDQAAMFVSVAGPALLAPLALGATEPNTAERQQFTQLTLRNDTLRQVASFKGCR